MNFTADLAKNPPQQTAADIVRQFREGTCTAASVLAASKARIEALDARLNCFTATIFERAAREAAAIDALRASGAALPALAGVPYAVKNLFDVEGEVTLAGGKINASNPPAAADAALVARLRSAGAILVGMLNMDEHAYGFTTENTHYGTTRNPHDVAHVAGGSSGGSAAAVAAGFVPLSLGSDTNGSIRVPAAFCGIFGLKPTFGRLSRRGVFPFVDSLDHVGPFAGTVGDLALAYDALQGPDAADPACAQRAIEPITAHLPLPRGIRIAILDGWFYDWADPHARRAVTLAASALGVSETATFAGAAAARSAAFIISAAEGGARHHARLLRQFADFEPLSRSRLVAGSLIPASWVIRAQEVRQRARHEALELFEHFDLLLAPATPVAAPLIGSETLIVNGHSMPSRASLGLLTQPISCIGLPVCTVPVWPGGDATASGTRELPLGVQLIAAPWREDICLGAARVLESAGIAACRSID